MFAVFPGYKVTFEIPTQKGEQSLILTVQNDDIDAFCRTLRWNGIDYQVEREE